MALGLMTGSSFAQYANYWPQASNSSYQPSNAQPQQTNYWPQQANTSDQSLNARPQRRNHSARTSNTSYETANAQPQATNFWPQTSNTWSEPSNSWTGNSSWGRPSSSDQSGFEAHVSSREFLANASYYSSGRRTANGEAFRAGGLTCASRTLPFGTQLRLTNPSTGRSVVVRVNDRGPFVRGRSLDVSRGAAVALGMIGSGVANLRVARLN
jgi:rare lipoprotein A